MMAVEEDVMMIRNRVLLLGLYLLSLNANASQLVRLEVDQQDKVYTVYVEMDVDAPADAVLAVLTDYRQLHRLSDSITDSEVIAAGNDGVVRVQTRIVNCVLFFCMNMQKVEDITAHSNGRITAAMVPGASDFRSGEAMWQVKSTGSGSRIIHQARLEPDMWIPSWMGDSIVKDSLRQELQQSFNNLECLMRAECMREAEAMQNHDDDRDEYI
jgi:carbon monoxide dehydrogenase subunit G